MAARLGGPSRWATRVRTMRAARVASLTLWFWENLISKAKLAVGSSPYTAMRAPCAWLIASRCSRPPARLPCPLRVRTP